MRDWERRQLIGAVPNRRKGAQFNLTTLTMSGRLCRDRSVGGTEYAVLHYLLDIVDHDGVAVATINHITSETQRSPSGVSAAIAKLQQLELIERVGKSAFRFTGNALLAHNHWSR